MRKFWLIITLLFVAVATIGVIDFSQGKLAQLTHITNVALTSSSTQTALTRQQLLVIIAQLQQQLLLLQQQMALRNGSQFTCTNLTRNLYYSLKDSETGGQVSKLQKFLKATGDFTYPQVTGYYGYGTLASVQRFQKRNNIISYGQPGITGYGTVGTQTRAVIKNMSCINPIVPTDPNPTQPTSTPPILPPQPPQPPQNPNDPHNPPPPPPPPTTIACSDRVDNDGDGLSDWPIDPGCSSLNDTSESGDPTRRPFYALTWEPSAAPNTDNLVPVYWIGRNGGSGFAPPDPVAAAAEMTRRGQLGIPRVMHDIDLLEGDFGLSDLLSEDSRDSCTTASGEIFKCIWWDNSVNTIRQKYQDFFTVFSQQGGVVDYLGLDFEKDFSNWAIGNDSSHWLAIQNDPRFASEGLAARLGFSDLSTVQNYSQSTNYLVWNSIMAERSAAYINQATYNVVRSFFPNVKMFNYHNFETNSRYSMRDYNGHNTAFRNTHGTVGSVGDVSMYGSLDGISQQMLDGQHYYARTPFNAFRYGINTLRGAKYSAGGGDVLPTIAYKNFSELSSYLNNSNYYQEQILHAALNGPSVIFYWNPNSSWHAPGIDRPNPAAEDNAFSQLLKEFEKIANYADKSSLENDNGTLNQFGINGQADWGADYLLSGMSAGGRKVWRFTPDLPESVSPMTKVISSTNSSARVQTNRGVITFPGGVIWTPTNPANLAPRGIWIVQPSGASGPTMSAS